MSTVVCHTCNTSSQDAMCSTCHLRLSKVQSILAQATSQTPLSGLAETIVDEHYCDVIRTIDLRRERMILDISDYSATLIALVEEQKQIVLANTCQTSLSRQLVQKNLTHHLNHLLGKYFYIFFSWVRLATVHLFSHSHSLRHRQRRQALSNRRYFFCYDNVPTRQIDPA